MKDLSDDAVTGFNEAEHNDDVTSTKLSNCDKENHDLNKCVESDLDGNDDLTARDVSTKKRMDVPVSDDRTGNHSMSLSVDKSEESDGVAESNQPFEILSDRQVTGSMSENGRYEVTSTGLGYDDNDHHDHPS